LGNANVSLSQIDGTAHFQSSIKSSSSSDEESDEASSKPLALELGLVFAAPAYELAAAVEA